MDKLGDFIAQGKSRKVYVHFDNPSLVIKKLKKSDDLNNKIEWDIWQAAQGTPYETVFCPCVNLLPNGDLIMLRCSPVTKKVEKKVTILGVKVKDTAVKNKGELNGRIVLIDYGHPENQKLIDALIKYKLSEKPYA